MLVIGSAAFNARRTCRTQSARLYLVVSLATAGLLAGCAQNEAQQQADHLRAGEAAYARSSFNEAIHHLGQAEQNATNNTQRARALYHRGLSLLQSNRRQLAIADLTQAAQLAPPGDNIGWRAYLTLGTTHFEDQKWAAAADATTLALRSMPERHYRDEALWRLGLAQERCGRWTAAQQTFRVLATQYRGSRRAKVASRRNDLRADHFGVQCGVYSRSDLAEAQADSLRSYGFEVAVRRERRDGLERHVVVVGRYREYAAARVGLATVQQIVPGAVLWP